MATTVRGRATSGKHREIANHCLQFCVRVATIWLLQCVPPVASLAESNLTNEYVVHMKGKQGTLLNYWKYRAGRF